MDIRFVVAKFPSRGGHRPFKLPRPHDATSVIEPIAGCQTKIVAVRFGFLGGPFRFAAPNLVRIPVEPLASCLCVTENRHAFIPWLLWNFDRQTWRKRELIIVDSSNPPIQVPQRSDVRVIRAPLGTWLGKKRNMALKAAQGEVVAWFDDDDWQHPDRLSSLIPLLRKCASKTGASFIGPSQSYFMDLYSDKIQPYEVREYAIFNGSVYYAAMVRDVPFPENVLRTEDTIWISRLLRNHKGATFEGEQPTLFMWLSHDANISNIRAWRHRNSVLQIAPAMFGSHWLDTRNQLQALRERLVQQPAQPPARAVWSEGASLERNRGSNSGAAPTVSPLAAPKEPPITSAPPLPHDTSTTMSGCSGAIAKSLNRCDARASGVLFDIRKGPPNSGLRLAVYGLSPDGHADLSGTDFLRFSQVKLGCGLTDAMAAVFSQPGREWLNCDYVGFLAEPLIRSRMLRFPDIEKLIANSDRSHDVYGFQTGELLSLNRHLANEPTYTEGVFNHIVLRRMGKPAWVLERKLPIFDSGFIARPKLLLQFLREWLVAARARLTDRSDADLHTLLAGQSLEQCEAAILNLLPAVFFCVQHCTVRLFEPSRLGVTAGRGKHHLRVSGNPDTSR